MDKNDVITILKEIKNSIESKKEIEALDYAIYYLNSDEDDLK